MAVKRKLKSRKPKSRQRSRARARPAARRKVRSKKGRQPRLERARAQAKKRPPQGYKDPVDEASFESFPASDPPAFSPTTTGETREAKWHKE